jgi:hypothetical protein
MVADAARAAALTTDKNDLSALATQLPSPRMLAI